MPNDQPQGESELGIFERLGNALMPEEPAVPAEASQPEAEQQPEAEEATEQEAATEQPVDDGLVDLEIEDGVAYRVPQQLKDGYMRNKDYTQKTQDLANLQKQVQFSLAERQIAQQFEQETKEDRNRLLQTQAEIARLKAIDWTSLETDSYIRTRGHLDNLKDAAAEIERTINEKAGSVRQKLAAQRQQSVQNAYEFIGRHVKGFSPESDVERGVAKYAQQLGVPPDALAEVAVMFPGFAVMAAKAAEFERLQSTKTVIAQKAQKAPPVIKPGVVNNNASQRTVEKQARQALKKDGSLGSLARYLELKEF